MLSVWVQSAEGMARYRDAAVAGLKESMRTTVESSVAVLLTESTDPSARAPDSLPFEEQLQWLRPSAFAAALQAARQVLYVHLWFHTHVARAMEAVLLSTDVDAASVAACRKQVGAALQGAMSAFQARWAKLLAARLSHALRAYARQEAGAQGVAGPPMLADFQTIVRLSHSVEGLASAHGRPATELRITLRGLTQHLLEVRCYCCCCCCCDEL